MSADRIVALLAEAPGALERASRLTPPRLPVLPAFEDVLPDGGLRPGTTVAVTGVGAVSLALALVARPSTDSWTAVVGLPTLGLRAAAEIGVELDRLVVVPDPGAQWDPVVAALVDAFDVVLIGGLTGARAHLRASKIAARVREHDAVLVTVGHWSDGDLTIAGTASTWHGIGRGYGHLRARTLTISVTGRGVAARPRSTTLWLPDRDGCVSPAAHAPVVGLGRTG
jgi:hypothetical protein